MTKIFFTLLLFFCNVFNSFAQDTSFEYTDSSLLNVVEETGTQEDAANTTGLAVEEKDILSDTTLYIADIDLSPDTVASWKKNKRFSYMNHIDSLLKIKKQQELDAYNEELNDTSSKFIQQVLSSGFLQVIFWSTAIVFVLFIMYRLFVSNGVFKRKTVENPVVESPAEMKLATVSDYDKLIKQSVDQADYRSAVRFLFLKTLVQLAERDYIQQSADKTNYQYVQEIRADLKNDFSSLVLNYEYTWYGNVALTRELYTGIENKFIAFYKKIQ